MAKIAVLGAGVMGLACAYELCKRGHAVEIFEADDRIGGMAAHFDFQGLDIERYYHFICKPDVHLFSLLEELGIEDKLRWRTTRMGYFHDGKLHPWGNPVALLKFPGLGLLSKLRYGFHAFISTKRSNWQDLDQIEASAWIKKWIGDKAYDVLWRRLFELKFYKYKDNLSAAWIWTRIKRVGLSRKNLFNEELGYLHGGSDALLKAFDAQLKELDCQIHLSCKVEKVEVVDNKVKSVLAGNRTQQFDQVISTIPLPYVPGIIPALPEKEKQQYLEIQNMGVVCVLFKLSRQLTENFWLNISDTSIDIPGVIEFSNLREMDPTIVYVPYYLPTDDEKFRNDNAFFIQEAKTYIKKLNPSLSEEDFVAQHASRYGFAQPVCAPGFLEQLPPIKSSVEGLYIADTSYYYPEDRSISESVRLGKEIAIMADA